MSSRPPGRHAGLTTEQVLKKALQILAHEGLEALSMRRLASELGVKPMSLYNHVEDRQAVLTGVLDLAVEEFRLPDARLEDWKDWVSAWMRSAYAIFAATPNLFGILLSPATPLGPRTLGMIDDLFGRLQDEGFDEKMQLRIWSTLRAYLFGSLVQRSLCPAGHGSNDLSDVCPHLSRALRSAHGFDARVSYEEGLTMMIAGMTSEKKRGAR